MFTKEELMFIWDALAVCRFSKIEYKGIEVTKTDLMDKVSYLGKF